MMDNQNNPIANIEGHPGLTKNLNTGVINNNNKKDRERYRIAKRTASNAVETQSELIKLKRDLAEFKEVREELNELKDLVKQLLNK